MVTTTTPDVSSKAAQSKLQPNDLLFQFTEAPYVLSIVTKVHSRKGHLEVEVVRVRGPSLQKFGEVALGITATLHNGDYFSEL